MVFLVFIYWYEFFKFGFEIIDQLGGNIFFVIIFFIVIIDVSLIVFVDFDYIGNFKLCIVIWLKNSYVNSKLCIEVVEIFFFFQFVFEFILFKVGKEYLVFLDIIWNYQVLCDNNQVVFVSIFVKVELNKKEFLQCLKIILMCSINECFLGYVDDKMKFYDMGEFFVVYVNEEYFQIDKLLCEVLDICIVNCFFGY